MNHKNLLISTYVKIKFVILTRKTYCGVWVWLRLSYGVINNYPINLFITLGTIEKMIFFLVYLNDLIWNVICTQIGLFID